ncbi:MAG: TrmH family RNA methyltransferase [Kangiellaceae bacterium]|jgi:TrmH family RNA methyltransferase
MFATKTQRQSNMKLDDVKKLHQKKYRTQLGYYLVEGEHLILELQKALKIKDSFTNIKLYVTEEYQDWARQLKTDFTISVISAKQMAHISNTKTPQGAVACVPLSNSSNSINMHVINTLTNTEKDLPKQSERCIYLHEVQDPGNLGTILRTLAWFGHFRLLLSPNSVDPFNPKVVRASMGAIFHVPIELEVGLSDLQKRFTKVAYLDMQGSKVNSQEFGYYDCYLFGNEARGVPLETLSRINADAFTIDGCGSIDSLNLASAVNMCVYQLSLN